MFRRLMVPATAALVLVVGSAPALAKRQPTPPEAEPTLTLELTCHMEPGGEIPFAHLDQLSTWAGLGNGRHTLVVVIPPQQPGEFPPEAGHSHQIFRTPNGSDFSHMDFGVSTGETLHGEAYIESRKGKVVARAVAEVTCHAVDSEL